MEEASALPMPEVFLGCGINEVVGMEQIGAVETHTMIADVVTPDVAQIGMRHTGTRDMHTTRRATRAIGTSRRASETIGTSRRATQGNGIGHGALEAMSKSHRATKANGTGHRRASKENGKLTVDDKLTFDI
jgi:hypothetical protein